MGFVASVNVGHAQPNPYKTCETTGMGKAPQPGAVHIDVPGRGGSGVAGDHIGDTEHHGGAEQAVYAFAGENLDRWAERLGRPLADGAFGENLTTRGVDVDGARLGEIWQVGDTLRLAVTSPRVPCGTFRGWLGEPGWLREFTADGRPGAYLRVLSPGAVRAGDDVRVVHRPTHDVTIALTFRAMLTERRLLPSLLEAGEDLIPSLRLRVLIAAAR